jgi:hypothetical protein
LQLILGENKGAEDIKLCPGVFPGIRGKAGLVAG